MHYNQPRLREGGLGMPTSGSLLPSASSRRRHRNQPQTTLLCSPLRCSIANCPTVSHKQFACSGLHRSTLLNRWQCPTHGGPGPPSRQFLPTITLCDSCPLPIRRGARHLLIRANVPSTLKRGNVLSCTIFWDYSLQPSHVCGELRDSMV